jgi:hypothetical protein
VARTIRFIVRDWTWGPETTATNYRTFDAPCPPELDRFMAEHEKAQTGGHWDRDIIGVELLPAAAPQGGETKDAQY